MLTPQAKRITMVDKVTNVSEILEIFKLRYRAVRFLRDENTHEVRFGNVIKALPKMEIPGEAGKPLTL